MQRSRKTTANRSQSNLSFVAQRWFASIVGASLSRQNLPSFGYWRSRVWSLTSWLVVVFIVTSYETTVTIPILTLAVAWLVLQGKSKRFGLFFMIGLSAWLSSLYRVPWSVVAVTLIVAWASLLGATKAIRGSFIVDVLGIVLLAIIAGLIWQVSWNSTVVMYAVLHTLAVIGLLFVRGSTRQVKHSHLQ